MPYTQETLAMLMRVKRGFENYIANDENFSDQTEEIQDLASLTTFIADLYQDLGATPEYPLDNPHAEGLYREYVREMDYVLHWLNNHENWMGTRREEMFTNMVSKVQKLWPQLVDVLTEEQLAMLDTRTSEVTELYQEIFGKSL